MNFNEFYTVIEVQMDTSGAYGVLNTVYETMSQAYSAYYSILASAALGSIPYHAAYILR